MGTASAWFKHLKMRGGVKIISQAAYMWYLHRTPFDELIDNILEILDEYQSFFTFPTVAYTAEQDVKLLRTIIKAKHEIASHGYKHIRYQFLPKKTQEQDLKKSLETFKRLGISIQGFRAPYNMYNEDTPSLIEKSQLLWDGGIGFRPEYRKGNKFFKIDLNGSMSSFTCIPLSIYTDDVLIDRHRSDVDKMGKVFRKVIDHVKSTGGVVMFDLHPIRIGQKKYLKSLEALVSYGNSLGGWYPTVSEAVQYWNKNKTWKHDANFCVLLTGDIDNFVFLRDYISRLLD
ncbi:MAG: polysaccharide deacetylase family protein [Candidatus Hodarchaeales archaeon]|jgi:peptidoglycan/xylan/chitin deacetylase (PgdA/CDA1 family)